MEIKVGQYARFDDNSIIKVELKDNYVYWKNNYGNVCIHKDNIKVANTPQELIQEKDLVELKGIGKYLVMYIENGINIYIWNIDGDYTIINNGDIIKILTPNTNGGYDLQWEQNQLSNAIGYDKSLLGKLGVK